MRQATKRDKLIAKKKHFEVGDIVKVRLLQKENEIYYHLITQKVHQYDGQRGTYYKTIELNSGKAHQELYLHDIPEGAAEVTLHGKNEPSAT
jgi:hypothetical protein